MMMASGEKRRSTKKLVAVLVFLAVTVAFATAATADSNVKDRKGVPTFVTGALGKLPRNDAKAAKDFLQGQRDLLKMTGTEDFDVVSTLVDKLGQNHVKLRESLHGLPVIGAEYVIHSD